MWRGRLCYNPNDTVALTNEAAVSAIGVELVKRIYEDCSYKLKLLLEAEEILEEFGYVEWFGNAKGSHWNSTGDDHDAQLFLVLQGYFFQVLETLSREGQETDTYEFLCHRFKLIFRGALPLAPYGSTVIEEGKVKDKGIFLAEDDYGRKVVLKFARFSHESSCYLRNEIDVLKKLYDAGYSSGVKYLDSEIIESHELCVLITLFCGKRIGGLRDINFQEWLKYSEGLCKAVAELHQHGFIHCDLSCNNVCLLKNEIKIIDFGLSVYCDSDGKSLNKIRTRGTGKFIAPEFSDDDKKFVTTAVDAFSVGKLLHGMLKLTENKPRDDENVHDMAEDLVEGLTRESVEERLTLQDALELIGKIKIAKAE
ncbi:hypothetical protein MP638_007497 [Amoeboaphelidium occidentale]|nr:hypothetical protein MP638_007497 [Amoeboaphelidium occidentale]